MSLFEIIFDTRTKVLGDYLLKEKLPQVEVIPINNEVFAITTYKQGFKRKSYRLKKPFTKNVRRPKAGQNIRQALIEESDPSARKLLGKMMTWIFGEFNDFDFVKKFEISEIDQKVFHAEDGAGQLRLVEVLAYDFHLLFAIEIFDDPGIGRARTPAEIIALVNAITEIEESYYSRAVIFNDSYIMKNHSTLMNKFSSYGDHIHCFLALKGD